MHFSAKLNTNIQNSQNVTTSCLHQYCQHHVLLTVSSDTNSYNSKEMDI